MPKSLFLSTIFSMLVLLGYAQVHQYGYEGQGDLPYWVQLMYSENPDMDQVIKEHIEYYKTHPFEKNAHTQYFKHWVHSRQIGTGIKTEEQIQSDKNYAQRLKNNLRTTSAGSWTCIGPFDYDEDAGSMSYAAGSAHVYTVEQSISNPNVLYAGTATAGIWKSTDKGMNWVLKTKDLMLTDVYSIEIDHTNENIVYAGASDGRLFKTTNGGNSWTEIGGSYFGANNNTIKDIVLHPTNPSIVFVASKSGFYRSTNGGSSFTQIGTGDYQEIEFHPTNPDIVYTVKLNTTTNRTEFYKSTNNGVTFTKKSTGWPSTGEQKRTEISVTPASPNRVYAYCTGSVNGGSGTYGTYLSTDQGETWTFQCCGSGPGGPPSASNKNLMGWDDKGLDDGGQYYYDMAYCVLPNDMNKVLLGGVNLWLSNDGGYDFTCPSKWSHSEKPQCVHADIHDIKAYGDDIWIACDGGIWYSNNAGATFEKRFKGIAGTDFWGFGIGYGANGHRVMTGGAYHNGTQVMDNDVYRGGWMVCNGGDGTGGEVNPVNDRMIFTDRGAQKLPGNRTAAITNLTFAKKPNNDYITGKASTIRYSPVNYNTVLLGEGTSLWKSTNGGVSFTQLYNFNEHVADFEISPLDEKTMYVATFGSVKKLYRTTNGGTSWTAITLPSTLDKSTGAPYDLVPSATNPNEIWIVKIGSTSALNGYKVFKSTDKGTTWQNLTTPTLNGENVVSITHHAGTNGGVYISTARTVYYRNASMSDWILFNNGLPAQTPSQKVLPDYWSGKLINATSRSVYESEFYEKAPPVAFFKADKVTTTCNGAAITFVDQSAVQGATGITRNWVFEGGIANSTTNGTVTVTYPLPGTYDVTLTVTDANGTHTRTIPDFITVTGSCTATTDIALNSITGITSGNKCSQQFTPSIEVLNSGVITITSYTVKVYLDGVLNKTLTQTTNLTSGQKATVNLGSFDLSNVAAFQVVLEKPNGVTDNLTNNSITEYLQSDFLTVPSVTVVSQSSYYPGEGAENMFDGNTATFWHNNWGANAPLPHTLVFNLGANYDLGGLDMLNRQSNSNGYPKEVEISTSVDGTNWSTPVTWTFTNTAGWQTAYFSGQGVRYLRLKVISTISGANTCSMAEIKLRGCDKKVLSAAITSPLSGASFYTNENVIISANAIPSDGKSITKVEFYVDNVLKGTVTTAPYQYNAGMLTAGSHTLKVIAYETGGTTATSALVPITIVPVVNYDAAISSLQMVALPTCGSSVNASYILTNKGVVTLTSIRSEIYLNNQLVETRTHSVNLAKNQTTAIALNSIAVSSSGNNVLKVKVIDPNNQTDENTADNEQTVNFTIGVGEEHQFYIATRSLNPSITWQIKSGTTVVVNSSNVTFTTSGNNTVQNFCLVPGCYDLVVTNAFQSGGCTAPAWSSSTIYLGDAGLGNGKGEIVSYNGRQYRAQWWTQNNPPGTNSVWLDLGVCNTTYPTDVYGLKNITTPATHVEVQQQNYSSPKSNNFCFGTTATADFSASTTTVLNCQNVTFTANTTGTVNSWLWNFGAGANPATATTAGPHTVTYTTTGPKTISLTINGNTTETKTNYVNVSQNTAIVPAITIEASSTTICAGTTVNFTIASQQYQGTAPGYSWRVNGTQVGTGTTFSSSTLSNNDKVTVVMTSNEPCATTTTATSNQITVTVNPSVTPTISIVASETTICNGTAVTFTATPSTAGTIQWKLNGNNVGTGGTTYTTSSLSNNDKVTAVLTASGSCLSTTTATSNQVTVIVNPSVTPTISITSSATTITQGTTVTFTASATSGTIQWKLNGNNVGSGATTYAISTLQNGDKVSAVLVSNAPCANPTSVSSNEITITVTPVGNTVSCSNVSSWNANAIYVQGDQCERNGIKYEAKWWTRGNDPVNYSGQWDVWKKLGDCTPGTYGQIAPTLVMNPSGDTTVAQNTTINIALKSVEAFTNVSYYLYSGEVLIATLNGSGLNFNAGWKAMQAGDFWLQVVATDNNNTKVYSNAILLAVQQVTEVTSNLTIGTIEVIPNPNNGTFSLSTKEVTNLENAKMEIIDMYGHTVYTGKISSSIEIIEVGKLNAGMYQLKVLKEDKVYISKFVIQQ